MKRKALGKTELIDSRSRFPRLLRPRVEELGSFKGDDPYVRMLFDTLEGFYSEKKDTEEFILTIGHIIDDFDYSLLDRILVFEGFESRTRQAFWRMVRLAADDSESDIRKIAYICFESKERREYLELMLERVALEEDYFPFYRALVAARALDRDGAREDEIKRALIRRMGSDHGTIRFESVFSLKPGRSERLHRIIWEAMTAERKPDVIGRWFGARGWVEHIIQTEKEIFGGNWVKEAFSRFLNARLGDNPGISYAVIVSLIPMMDSVAGFIDALTPETRERLLAETEPQEGPQMALHHATLGRGYLRAALTGSLESVEVLGRAITFCRMPSSKLGSLGRVHNTEIAVALELAEEMVPIVAYHEYIEGKTGSHEAAVIAEREAVKSLGLEREYAAWLEVIGENDR